ncbi:MAG: peroxiredoxin family protein [Chloroflexi bacterium]|nr:peroxiredoxin family protein [Chloroflexota bacterium]
MAALARDRHAFRARGAQVVVVGPEGPDEMRRFWTDRQMPFVGLADPTHVAAERYAQEVSLLKLGRMPALFVIDRSGQVRYAHYASSMSDIPENDEVLAVLDDVAQAPGGAEDPDDLRERSTGDDAGGPPA